MRLKRLSVFDEETFQSQGVTHPSEEVLRRHDFFQLRVVETSLCLCDEETFQSHGITYPSEEVISKHASYMTSPD